MEPSTPKQSMAVPVAIIAGFAMIAIAIFFTGGEKASAPAAITAPTEPLDSTSIRPVTADDYILGNPNAPIVLIEYSDYDCPFCKQYHATMHQVLDEYGITGRIAWVYRQFPLIDLHPNAPLLAEAALCVGDLGDDTAFWTFSDSIFESRQDTEFTNVTRLPELAVAAGVDRQAYLECMESDRMMDDLKADMADGLAAGAQGTPYTVIKVGSQEAVINGAQPYDVVKGIVENLIAQLDGNFDPATADVDSASSDQ